MAKLTIVRAVDWEALYVDGVLVYEDHSVTDEALQHTDIKVVSLTDECDDALSNGAYSFPKQLADIPSAYLYKEKKR